MALARSGTMAYESSGNGTTTHLGAEWLFRGLAKVDITHVPFQPAAATNAVVSGQVPIASTSMPPAVLDFLNNEINKALGAKSVQDRFETLLLEAIRMDRPTLRRYVGSEVGKWGRLVKDLKIQVQ